MTKRLHPFWYDLPIEQRRAILNGAYGHIARDMERRHTKPARLHLNEEARQSIDDLLDDGPWDHRKG